MSGKTDPQIVREIFRLAELADDHIDTLMPDALAAVSSALAGAEDRICADGRRRCRASWRSLERLAATPRGAPDACVTGNLVANAAVKLTALGLEPSSSTPRSAPTGPTTPTATRAGPDRARPGHAPAGRALPARPGVGGRRHRYDLACARAAGVRCLLVGTGTDGFDGVRRLPADAVLPDLADTAMVRRILLADDH